MADILRVAVLRRDLSSGSYYMRYINESLARMTNEEDAFKVRFNSQTILDTNACLAVLAYVDLAPIRAGLASLVSEDVNN